MIWTESREKAQKQKEDWECTWKMFCDTIGLPPKHSFFVYLSGKVTPPTKPGTLGLELRNKLEGIDYSEFEPPTLKDEDIRDHIKIWLSKNDCYGIDDIFEVDRKCVVVTSKKLDSNTQDKIRKSLHVKIKLLEEVKFAHTVCKISK